MKILIHIPQLIYGGAEKVLVDFANFLVERGNEVEVLETYEKGYLKPQFNSKVTFNAICSKAYTQKYYASFSDIKGEKNLLKKGGLLAKKLFSILVGYERFAKYLSQKHYRTHEYDVAINYLEIESPEFILNNIKARKYLQWIHIDVSMAQIPQAYIKDYMRMDKIIGVSQYAKDRFVEKHPQLCKRTEYLYNFYNKEEIIHKADAENVQLSSGFNILSVGRMTEQKAYDRAIDVIACLKHEGYDFVWYIIGSGAEYDNINNKIKTFKLQDTIKLLGIKDNPYPYIKACDLFFLPSKYEGFPTVTIEAKVLRKPVLATEVSGIREQIADGVNGIIVENSEDGIYNGLKRVLDNPMMLGDLCSNESMDGVLENDAKYKLFMEIIK